MLPLTESLKETVARVLPYWHDRIVPDILAGGRVLIAGGLTDGLTNHGEGGQTAPAVPTVEVFQ